MKITSVILGLCLLFISCSEKVNERPSRRPGTDKIEVVLPVAESFDRAANYAEGELPATRTTILGDAGLDKAAWTETDKVAIWASPEGGGDFTLTAETFSYYTPLQGNALFTATIPEMTGSAYIYYGAYPVPNTINGTQVTYTLPAEQTGAYDGELDIMLAHPAQGSALTENTSPKAAQLAFAHKCHIMRIQVPTGRNLWGEKIHKLRIEFPTEVVGELTFDITDPTAAPTFANGGKTVMLLLKQPLDESVEDAPDGNYAWLFLRPGATIDGEVKFTAYTSGGYQAESLTINIRKTLEQGRITPVTLTIPRELPVSFIDFSVAGNNLGEELQKLHITAPQGATFRNGANHQSFSVNAQNKYVLGYYEHVDGRANGDMIRNTATTIRYESQNALVPEQHTFANSSPGAHTPVSLTVPYLLSEDFSTVTTFSNNEGTTGINDPDAIWIPGLSEWSAARVGGSAGKSVRIVGHREGGMWIFADYEARMDSAPLSGIKSGASVNVQINFKYSGSTNKGAPKLKYGTSTLSGLISGASTEIQTQAGNITTSKNGSYDSVTQTAAPFTATCTNGSRISWVAYGSDGGFSGSYFYYVYIDQVTAQIIQ